MEREEIAGRSSFAGEPLDSVIVQLEEEKSVELEEATPLTITSPDHQEKDDVPSESDSYGTSPSVITSVRRRGPEDKAQIALREKETESSESAVMDSEISADPQASPAEAEDHEISLVSVEEDMPSTSVDEDIISPSPAADELEDIAPPSVDGDTPSASFEDEIHPASDDDIPQTAIEEDITEESVEDIPPASGEEDVPSTSVEDDIPPASDDEDIPPTSIEKDTPASVKGDMSPASREENILAASGDEDMPTSVDQDISTALVDDDLPCASADDGDVSVISTTADETAPSSADHETDTTPVYLTIPASKKSSPSFRRKSPKGKKLKVGKQTVSSPKASVPMVTVTAPSDQSDDGEVATPVMDETASVDEVGLALLASFPEEIKSTDRLPAGWKRVAKLRTGGKYIGRYDTNIYSDTGFRMRSFPNVKAYLEKTDQLDLLDDEQYKFDFKQPLTTPKLKNMSSAAGSPKAKTSSAKVSLKAKTPTSSKLGKAASRKRPANVIEESTTVDSRSSDNAMAAVSPKKVKGRKKSILPSKKDSPQLKLDAFIARMKSPQAAKESKFKSSFKSVLRQDFVSKKVEALETVGVSSGEDETGAEETAAPDDVYLAEEQEDPYKSEEEDAPKSSGEKQGGPEEEKEDDVLSEECPSEASTIYELKSEESDSSLPNTLQHKSPLTSMPRTSQAVGSLTSKRQSTSSSRKSAKKRSLSPSDSDASVHKPAKRWRETDEEEDSSRSVGMCSDISMPTQEEDENQNMASKVQKMHLSDSSSSRDIKDSASTSSSNSGSLALTALTLSPSSRRSKVKAGRRSAASLPGKNRPPAKTSISEPAPTVDLDQDKSPTASTNGAAPTRTERWKLHRDIKWTPPRSPFNLIQERLFHDPWKMLVATIFLSEARAEIAIPLLWKFLNRWPTVEHARKAETERIARMLQPMEHNEDCAATVVRFSDEYVTKDWKYPIELYGIEKYGNDSYKMFCVPEWRQVRPDDDRLNDYYLWLTQNHQELGVE